MERYKELGILIRNTLGVMGKIVQCKVLHVVNALKREEGKKGNIASPVSIKSKGMCT